MRCRTCGALSVGSSSCRQARSSRASSTACGATLRPTPTTAMRRRPTASVSIRIPPSLRPRPGPSSSQRSLGHFRPMRAATLPWGGSSASASATPAASDSPPQSAGASGSASEKVSEAPRTERQVRPWRPRPWVCSSATSRQGRVSTARRPSGGAASGAPSRTPGRVAGWPGQPPDSRTRSSSRLLVDSQRATTSTETPGSTSHSRLHSASTSHDGRRAGDAGPGGLTGRSMAVGTGERAGRGPSAWARASCRGSAACRSGKRTAA